MSALPTHASLGIDKPRVRVLEWYLACAHPREYERMHEDLNAGRELMNPFEAFENLIRRQQPIEHFKTGLTHANNCFPRYPEVAKDAARWMLRWEPELARSIGRTLVGERVQEDTSAWIAEKHMAHALISAQMMAANWENKKFVERWNERLSYRNDLTPERRQVATAHAYWNLLKAVHPNWTEVVWEAALARANPKHRDTLEKALAQSHEQLQKRPAPVLPGMPGSSPRPGLPGFPELPTRPLVAPARKLPVPAQ